MNLIRMAVAVASGAVCASSGLSAQPGGPYGPLVLVLPAGARTLALGNTGVGGRDDDVFFFNPGQLAIARGTSASLERYSASSGGGALSSITRLANSTIALGMRVVDYEPVELTVTGDPRRLPEYPATRASAGQSSGAAGVSVEAGVGYARTIKRVKIGAVAKYVEDEVPGLRVGRAAFDVGAAKDLFGVTWGLAVQNIGKGMAVPCDGVTNPAHGQCLIPPLVPGSVAPPQTTTVNLPLRSTFGASLARQAGELDLYATGSVSVLRKNFVIPSGGAELSYSWIDGYAVALRAGARRPLPGEGTITAGAGLTADRVSIDYALEALGGGRLGHRVGLRVR